MSEPTVGHMGHSPDFDPKGFVRDREGTTEFRLSEVQGEAAKEIASLRDRLDAAERERDEARLAFQGQGAALRAALDVAAAERADADRLAEALRQAPMPSHGHNKGPRARWWNETRAEALAAHEKRRKASS